MSYQCYGCLSNQPSGTHPYRFSSHELKPTPPEINRMRQHAGRPDLQMQNEKLNLPPNKRVYCQSCINRNRNLADQKTSPTTPVATTNRFVRIEPTNPTAIWAGKRRA